MNGGFKVGDRAVWNPAHENLRPHYVAQGEVLTVMNVEDCEPTRRINVGDSQLLVLEKGDHRQCNWGGQFWQKI